VKEFWIYTGLRIVLFLGSFAIVFGIWAAAADEVPVVWAVVIAFVVSGVGSYYLLRPQREAFARRVDERAQRASQKLEEMRSKEDTD
jgi:membrane protein implicated in regulation of membrane protease activity